MRGLHLCAGHMHAWVCQWADPYGGRAQTGLGVPLWWDNLLRRQTSEYFEELIESITLRNPSFKRCYCWDWKYGSEGTLKIMYFTLLTEDWNPGPRTYSRHLTTTWDSRSRRFHTLFWPPQTPTDMWHTHMQTWCTNIHINLKNSIKKAMPSSKNTITE